MIVTHQPHSLSESVASWSLRVSGFVMRLVPRGRTPTVEGGWVLEARRQGCKRAVRRLSWSAPCRALHPYQLSLFASPQIDAGVHSRRDHRQAHSDAGTARADTQKVLSQTSETAQMKRTRHAVEGRIGHALVGLVTRRQHDLEPPAQMRSAT